MKEREQRPDPALFLHQTEEQARQHRLAAVRLQNGSDTLLGLALFLPDLPSETARAALAQAGCLLESRPESETAAPCGLSQADLGEQNALLELIQQELTLHRESRLPCSLLLLGLASPRPKTGSQTRCQVVTAIEPLLDHQDSVTPCDDQTLAVLLPATSLGKARRRAADIQAALAQGPHLTCCGLSVCHAHEPISAHEFLERTRRELERAITLGNGSLCHAALATVDDSCQVTVEERAELFSFLAKD